MVGTCEYGEEDCVLAFGQVVIAAVQRPETHIYIDIMHPAEGVRLVTRPM